MGKTAQGFTLVELMVVIAIMAVVGTVTIANYRSFGEDRKLESSLLDVQSLLRQAQNSATTNEKCNNSFGAEWQVQLDSTTVNLKCQEPQQPLAESKKTIPLGANIIIKEITGSFCTTALPLTISFEALTGKSDLAERCNLTITFQNSKTGTIKSLGIDQGGRIYEK